MRRNPGLSDRDWPAYCQVVLVAGSMHHLMSGLAYVETLRQRSKVSHLNILCDGFLGIVFRPDENVLERIQTDYNGAVSVMDFGDAVSDFGVLEIGRGECVFYITPRWFSARIYFSLRSALSSGGRLFWIESEEGVGSYRSLWGRLKETLVEWDFARSIKILVNGLLDRFLVKHKIRFLDRDSRSLRAGRELDSVRRLYQRYYSASFRPPSVSGGRSVMLYASQPAVELGWISSRQYREFIGKMRKHAEGRGYEYRVKPHPSEDRGKYESSVVYEEGASVEDVIVNDPSVHSVASVSSTALYSSKIVRDVESVVYVDEALYDRIYRRPAGALKLIKVLSDEFFVI